MFSSSQTVKIATGNFNQDAMGFDKNLKNLQRGIIAAKVEGATIFVSSELSITGYSCEDHFLELDTFEHSLESLAEILPLTEGILCIIGCPIIYNNTRYNCVVACVNCQIVLIRPKMIMADDGNYRERRFFTSWKSFETVNFELPPLLRKLTGVRCVPFGFAILRLNDTKVGIEMCEELWAPENTSAKQFRSGAEIIVNPSASHWELGKLSSRSDLIQAATKKTGGVYVYANQIGCDGNRLFFDGSSMIFLNGSLIKQASFFSLKTVEIISANINLRDVRSYRQASSSLQEQLSSVCPVTEIPVDFAACHSDCVFQNSDAKVDLVIPDKREEIVFGPACYLWDYLRKSYTGGFLLPLSGGADSAAVAAIVFMMCKMVILYASNGDPDVIADLTRILKTCNIKIAVDDYHQIPCVTDYRAACTSTSLFFCGITPQILCHQIMHTIYLGTDFSSSSTRGRALALANQIGSYHIEVSIQPIVSATIDLFVRFLGKRKRSPAFGYTMTEDLALQNIQARIRTVVSYLYAQLIPWFRGEDERKPLLVLSSSNVDEGLRGYLTKYDCSSGDINPIGAMSKTVLNRTLHWLSDVCGLSSVKDIVEAPPTAELRPIEGEDKSNYTQKDEDEMGFTYKELGELGELRKTYRCGPVSMYLKLLSVWTHMTPTEVATKVKNFFRFYAINRHKMTTITPSVHSESYSHDDNRYDLRPFLMNVNWPRQFATIDRLVKETKVSF
jgi:NAD+ synthase (glutamine-hydrolysing)